MATVRFSEALRGQIRKNAHNLFASQIEAADQSFNKQLFDGLYERLFGDYTEHLNKVPPEFFKQVQRLDIHVHRGAQAVLYEMGREYPVPIRDFSIPGRFRMTSHYSAPDVYLDSDCPEWDALREEYEAWRVRKTEVNTKLVEFQNMVGKIIESHATLAPALKVWPALWELIPEDVKERHKQIKESRRNKVKKELEDVDFGKLTAAVTVSKLRGR